MSGTETLTALVEATEIERCDIVAEAEEKLAELGFDYSWECLAAGAMMGAKFAMCPDHYREMLKRIRDHVESELVKEQLN